MSRVPCKALLAPVVLARGPRRGPGGSQKALGLTGSRGPSTGNAGRITLRTQSGALSCAGTRPYNSSHRIHRLTQQANTSQCAQQPPRTGLDSGHAPSEHIHHAPTVARSERARPRSFPRPDCPRPQTTNRRVRGRKCSRARERLPPNLIQSPEAAPFEIADARPGCLAGRTAPGGLAETRRGSPATARTHSPAAAAPV